MNITQFIHSTGDGHLSYVQVGTIINKTNAFFFLLLLLLREFSFFLTLVHVQPSHRYRAGQFALAGLAVGPTSPLSSGHVFSGEVLFVKDRGIRDGDAEGYYPPKACSLSSSLLAPGRQRPEPA